MSSDATHQALEARVMELESKLAFQDDTIEQLNQEITSHQASIARLEEQIRLLGNRFNQIKEEMNAPGENTPVHEIPPHY